MNPTLRPETIRAIRRFGARRHRLLMLRGICAFLFTIMLGWMALAAVDGTFIIEDGLRWSLSLAAYGLAAAVAWITSWRYLFGARGQRDLARLLERAEPSLHEDMLSAVELAEDDHPEFDSEAFRQRLQDNTALKAGSLNIARLLPAKRLGRWFGVVALVLAGLVSLFFVPGFHFPQLLARAALPFFNLARPSDTIIMLVEPDPADRIVPFHETVSLVVELDGRLPRRVLLDTVDATGSRARVELIRERGNRFLGSIHVGQESIRYRLQAGGAITRYHQLDARPRPSVVRFDKTYLYPEYTGLEPRQIEEDHGDLSALEGTTAKLSLQLNQPISSGELILDPVQRENAPLTIELGASDGDAIEVDIPIERAHDSYQVQLVARESGFTNDQSPSWRIEALPDLPPAVQWIDPTVTQLEVRPSDQFNALGRATDDVALTQVFQEYRVSGGEWVRVPLLETEGREAQVPLEWYLRPLNLSKGDIVLTKLVAVDALGLEGESLPLRLVVMEDLQDPDKREFAEVQTRLDAQLQELVRDSRELREAAERAHQALRNEPEERNAEQQQNLMQAQDAAAAVEERFADVRQALRDAMEQAPGRVEQQELRAVGERLAEMQAQQLQRAEQALNREQPANLHHNADQAREESRDLAARAERLQNQFAQIASEDNAVLAQDTLERLQSLQQEVAEAAREGRDAEELAARLQDQQQAALEQARQAVEDLRALEDTAGGNEANRARDMANALEEQAQQVAEAMQAEEAPQALPDPARDLDRRSEEFAHNTEQLADHFEQRAADARRQLMQDHVQPLAEAVQQAREAAEQLAQRLDQAGLTEENLDQAAEQHAEAIEQAAAEAAQAAAEAAAEAGLDEQAQAEAAAEAAADAAAEAAAQGPDVPQPVAEAAEAFQQALEAAAEQARQQAALHEIAPTASPQQVVDESRMGRALDQMAQPQNQPQTAEQAQQAAEQIAALEQAQRALAADAEATDLADALADLQRQERFTRDPDVLNEDSPAQWEQLQQQMDQLPRAIEQSPIDNAVAQQAREAAQSEPAQDLGQQMDQRQQQAGQDEPAAPDTRAAAQDLAELREQFDDVRAQMADEVAAARDLLAEAAPSVPEMMRDLAAELQQQQQQAAEAAQDARGEDAAPEPLAAQAEAMIPDAAAAEPALQDIMDAIRQEAGAADLTQEQARQEAWAADVAAAELAQQQPQAADHLEQAAAAEATDQQADAFDAAAADQQQLADTLDLLAGALDAIASGEPLAADAAAEDLAQMAEDLGVADALAENFQRAEDLAQMLDQATQAAEQGDMQSAQELMQALEAELAQNPMMQDALGQIAEAAAEAALDAIGEAAQAEADLAGQVAEQSDAAGDAAAEQPGDAGQMEQAAAQQEQLAGQVAEAGQDLARAGRHEERLGEQPVAEALQELGQAAQELAAGEMQQAAEALAANEALAPAAEAVGEADAALQELAANLPESPLDFMPPGEPGAPEAGAPEAGAPEAGAPEAGAPEAGQPGAPEAGQPGAPEAGQPGAPEAGQPGAPEAGQPGAPESGQPAPPSPAEGAQGSMLADALDQLDQMMNAPAGEPMPAPEGQLAEGQQPGAEPGQPQPGEPGSEPGQPQPGQGEGPPAPPTPLQQLLSAAAQQQGQEMARQRAQQQQMPPMPGQPQQPMPGEPQPGDPMMADAEGLAMETEGNQGQVEAPQALPEADIIADERWGRLPSKMAQDLVEGQRQGVAPEYRNQIEAYYRALAEKARER